MPKNITIFTTNTCSYCVMVKRWLSAKGYSYEEVNLEEHPEKQAEALNMSGSLTVPITVITKQDDSQEVIVGYNLSRLAPGLAQSAVAKLAQSLRLPLLRASFGRTGFADFHERPWSDVGFAGRSTCRRRRLAFAFLGA